MRTIKLRTDARAEEATEFLAENTCVRCGMPVGDEWLLGIGQYQSQRLCADCADQGLEEAAETKAMGHE